jgi:hypothetical protein
MERVNKAEAYIAYFARLFVSMMPIFEELGGCWIDMENWE